MRESFHGLLVLDKPAGMTSRDAVNRAQRWFPRGTKVGHTGTLDPLATGVLVVCVGAATRLAEYVQRMEKVYHARVHLGARSDTDDADGTITPVDLVRPLDRAAVERALQGFVGEIEQVPPAYSAAKVTGKRAYDLARRGEDVSLQARPVRIHAIDLLTYDYPLLELTVRCGKGTYIRSLARDLGERLGCGGYIETLRRERVGCFVSADAIPLETEAGQARACLRPLADALCELPSLVLSAHDLARLRQGQTIQLLGSLPVAGDSTDLVETAVFDSEGAVTAVAAVDPRNRLVRPERVFAT
jgi:tRNA pseudouridine55 synthase